MKHLVPAGKSAEERTPSVLNHIAEHFMSKQYEPQDLGQFIRISLLNEDNTKYELCELQRRGKQPNKKLHTVNKMIPVSVIQLKCFCLTPNANVI